MLIKLFIYDKKTGLYLYTDIGQPSAVIHDLGDDKDFTLTALPSLDRQWYWYNKAWHDKPQGAIQ